MRRAAVVSIMSVLQVSAAAGHEPPVVGVGGHSVEVPRVAVPVPAGLQPRLSPVAVHHVRLLLLLLAFVADVLMVAGDVVGVVLWQAVRSVQVVRSREGGQGGRLRALGGGVGELVRLLRWFVCSWCRRTLSHPPEQGFARARLIKRENVVERAPAGDNDDNENKCEEKPSDGSSNHDQEGKTICK